MAGRVQLHIAIIAVLTHKSQQRNAHIWGSTTAESAHRRDGRLCMTRAAVGDALTER